MEVVDVDGSYLYRKHKVVADAGMRVAPLPLPSPPLSGWESVSQENVAEIAKKVPHVTSGWYVQAHRYASSARLHAYISSLCNVGVVYTYLASGAGRSAGEGTFRALTRGFIHWQSGRIDKLEGALPKLVSFYNNCVVPEIVSPVHTLGIPIRDLSKL